MSQKSRSRSPSAGDSQASGKSRLFADTPGAAADDEILTLIAARKSTDEFPLVKPSEVDEAKEQAEEALTWVRKDEAVRLQSYIDHMYKLYREALPMSAASGKPESVIHAEWARGWYYFHLRAFLSQADWVGEDTFVSPVPPELLPASEQMAAKTLLLELKK